MTSVSMGHCGSSERSVVRPADTLLDFTASARLQEGGCPHQRHRAGSYSNHGSLTPLQHQHQVDPSSLKWQGTQSITVPALH